MAVKKCSLMSHHTGATSLALSDHIIALTPCKKFSVDTHIASMHTPVFQERRNFVKTVKRTRTQLRKFKMGKRGYVGSIVAAACDSRIDFRAFQPFIWKGKIRTSSHDMDRNGLIDKFCSSSKWIQEKLLQGYCGTFIYNDSVRDEATYFCRGIARHGYIWSGRFGGRVLRRLRIV